MTPKAARQVVAELAITQVYDVIEATPEDDHPGLVTVTFQIPWETAKAAATDGESLWSRIHHGWRGFVGLCGNALIFGTIAGLVAFMLNDNSKPPIFGALQVSDVARKVADWIGPELQDVARKVQPEFVAGVGNPVARWATGYVYPHIVNMIPDATAVGCDRLLDRFGQMPTRELAEMLVDHAKSKGTEVHWTVRATAEGRRP